MADDVEKKEKKDALVNFRFSPEEVAELDRLAKEAHLTKTALVKERVFAPAMSSELVRVSGDLAKMSSQIKDVSRRLFDVEKANSILARRIDASKKDADIIIGKSNAILFAVAVFGSLSVLAVIASAMVLRRLILM